MNLTETAFHFVPEGERFYTVLDDTLILRWTKLRHGKARCEDYGSISHFGDLTKVFI
jgi:hypothetical protein